MTQLSILDLAPICQGADVRTALQHSLTLAQRAEALGYARFWVAEHHNMTGVASAATAVVIGHIAGGTSRIRVGAGGIMLPNHAPLVIAEQFGTLAALFPERIDLGLGRAPGSDGLTQRALRRSAAAADHFADDVRELQAWFAPAVEGQAVQAVPGAGLRVPLYILGSSLFGAQLAAKLGLPYAFAAHFAPQMLGDALAVYRRLFTPSEALEKPYVMVGVNVVAADSEREARRVFSSVQQAFVNLRRGRPGPLPAPREDFAETLAADDRALLQHTLGSAIVGTPDTVRGALAAFAAQTGADELILTSHIFDLDARLASLEGVAMAMPELANTPSKR